VKSENDKKMSLGAFLHDTVDLVMRWSILCTMGCVR